MREVESGGEDLKYQFYFNGDIQVKIQSGKNPVKRRSAAPQQAPASFSKLKPVLFVLTMIIMVGVVCELQVYYKSKISTTAAEISKTKAEIKRTERELVNLRNLIAERTGWSYVRSQLVRFGIKLRRPEAGQMHNAELLSESAVRIAAANMRRKLHEQRIAQNTAGAAAVPRVQNTTVTVRRRVSSPRSDLQRYEFR